MEHVKPTINTNPRKLMVRVGQLPGEVTKVRSDQWHVKIDGFVSSQLGDTWVPLHYKFIFKKNSYVLVLAIIFDQSLLFYFILKMEANFLFFCFLRP